jgi:hypothetical protein
VSADLATKIQLGLDQLAEIRSQLSPLMARTGEPDLPVMETAAACAMLHSFYTEVEKILRLIAIEHDGVVPASESWHRDLLHRMARPGRARPAVISAELLPKLAELLAFRHLFRGASIVLMRWNKLAPLVAALDATHTEIVIELGAFQEFVRQKQP